VTKKKFQHNGSEGQSLFGGDPGILASMISTTLQTTLREEMDRYLGAGHYERSDQRRGWRNGVKPRTIKTGVGLVKLEVPQARDGGFRTTLFDRYQRSDRALVAAMQEMVVKGVSTREVSAILEELAGFEVSAATVSRAMAELDEQIHAFFSRRLDEHTYPFVVIDARYEKVRSGPGAGRVRSHAVLVAAGINDQGRREVLALATGDSESAQTWGDLFKSLKERGLSGVELVVSDAHGGIRAALDKHMQGASWQRCRVHLMREMMNKVSWRDRDELAKDLRSIYANEDPQRCMQVAAEVGEKWRGRAAKMAQALLEGVEDTLTVLTLAPRLVRKLHSTNMLERVMQEIKRRTKKIRIFPNEASCFRLVGAVLMELDEKWSTQVCYLNLDHRD
jgi:putative transposase